MIDERTMKVIKILEESLSLAPGSTFPAQTLDTVDGWNSMGIVTFLSACMDQLDADVAVDSVVACTTVQEVVDLVSP